MGSYSGSDSSSDSDSVSGSSTDRQGLLWMPWGLSQLRFFAFTAVIGFDFGLAASVRGGGKGVFPFLMIQRSM